MKAILHYDATPGFRALIDEQRPAWLEVAIVSERDTQQFLAELDGTTALLHCLEPVTAAFIEAGPNLKLVQKIGVGVNTIDLDAARAHGVGVANMPGSNAQAVAECALSLMLAVLRRTRDLDRSVRAGTWWSLDATTLDAIGELAGRRVGLVGYGSIPRRLAPVLAAIGAEVVYWTRAPKSDAIGTWVELDELCATADVVSLHVPLVADTEKLFGRERLNSMKPGAVLINTARGGLVDEPALVDALRDGPLRGAGLDVFATEPLGSDSPLCQLDNVVLSPHVAWLTPETLARSMTIAFENCRRVRDGEPLLHEVVPYRR